MGKPEGLDLFGNQARVLAHPPLARLSFSAASVSPPSGGPTAVLPDPQPLVQVLLVINVTGALHSYGDSWKEGSFLRTTGCYPHLPGPRIARSLKVSSHLTQGGDVPFT